MLSGIPPGGVRNAGGVDEQEAARNALWLKAKADFGAWLATQFTEAGYLE
jgi:hypothetical protein